MADYWGHWLSFGDKNLKLPKIFRVNWFLKNEHNKFIWPGFSENARVLRWMVDRVEGKVQGNKTPIGTLPNLLDLGVDELNLANKSQELLLSWNEEQFKSDLVKIQGFLAEFDDKIPSGIKAEVINRIEALNK
jgi:phosphoenolpyruvate carboxykinase (GTP)